MMITIAISKVELKAEWKELYQLRKKFSSNGVLPSGMNYGYFTGRMHYIACLLSTAIDTPLPAHESQPQNEPKST